MLLQSTAVADVFRGRDSGWKPQRRDDGSLPTTEIMQFHSKHMIIGAGLAALTLYSSFILFLWMLPATLASFFLARFPPGRPRERLAKPSGAWGFSKSRKRKRRLQLPARWPRFKQGSKRQSWNARRSHNSRRASNCVGSIASSSRCSRFSRVRISPNLAIGRAKLEVSTTLTELLNLLKPGEKAALLSDPESLARLEALIPAEIPPETPHHPSLQTLEQTP